MDKKVNLSQNLEKLNEIATWFDDQTQIDVEEGLKKVKEAAALIKESKARLKEIENEFTEIKAEIEDTDEELEMVENMQKPDTSNIEEKSSEDEEVAPNDIPF